MAVGRPPLWKTPEELQAKIDDYFNHISKPLGLDKDGIPYYEPITITGLALHIGCYRETILNYSKKDEFFDTIKTARLRCENFAEKKIFGNNPTGAIFALKNYGWEDKVKNEHTGDKENPLAIVQYSPEEAYKKLLEDDN